MYIFIKAIHEDQPGQKWQELFEKLWPHYQTWFLSEGHLARPGYLTSAAKLQAFMPELMPIYEQLIELAGGGDLEARFLTMYCPPPYMSGCSQAARLGDIPILVRNYDYSPRLFEGNLLYTAWRRPVIATSDSLWGVLDGINDAGLALSLTFGGRKIVGEGFGAPLILRYVLECCDSTMAAVAALQRIPTHMPYNVTVLDRSGAVATVFLSPDRPAIITDLPVSTNHQGKVEWEDYARVTSSELRMAFLQERLADPAEGHESFVRHFLQPPLYNTQYEKAFGTLYTAVYYPLTGEVELRWPEHRLQQSLAQFQEKKITINLAPAVHKKVLL